MAVLHIWQPFLPARRSFKDKVDLLDEALRLHDGDAVLAVTLFAQRTLNRNKFLELIVTRPQAAREDKIQSWGYRLHQL